jgi:hypothetical protein
MGELLVVDQAQVPEAAVEQATVIGPQSSSRQAITFPQLESIRVVTASRLTHTASVGHVGRHQPHPHAVQHGNRGRTELQAVQIEGDTEDAAVPADEHD